MNSSDGMLIVNVSAIQAVAIAAVTYYFGACRTGALLLGVFPPHAG